MLGLFSAEHILLRCGLCGWGRFRGRSCHAQGPRVREQGGLQPRRNTPQRPNAAPQRRRQQRCAAAALPFLRCTGH